MFSKNKLTKSFLALAFCLSLSANASAGENKIFIKLHDIKPIKSGDMITECELKATAFNNTDIKISTVNVNLNWEDKYLVRNKIKTDKINSKVSFSDLKPASQVTKKIKVDTNRCFLLTEEPNLNVRGCKALDKKDSSRCTSAFKFVSPMDEEYYAEFKDIVEGSKATEKKIKEQVDKKLKDIEDLVKKVVTTNKDTVSVLEIEE